MEPLSDSATYSYEFSPDFEIAECQEIVQLFYLALASYELNIEIPPNKLLFTGLVAPRSLAPYKLNEPIPEEVAKVFQALPAWKDFFIKGHLSIQQRGEFSHELFLPFFILESKLIDFKKSVVSHQTYHQLMRTMVEDADLTSFSLPVLYSLDINELKLLYSVLDEIQILLSQQWWCNDYREVKDELLKFPTYHFVYPDCCSIDHFLKYPRARKAWLMYRLCIPPKKLNSVDSWVKYFKETYKWMMQRAEKIYRVIHPSRKYKECSIFFCLRSHSDTYRQRNDELNLTLVYYMMKEFHLPDDLVEAYCDKTIQKLLTDELRHPTGIGQDGPKKENFYISWYCAINVNKMFFNTFVGKEPKFDKSGRIKLVEEFELLSEHFSFDSNVVKFDWLFDYLCPRVRGRYWIGGPKVDDLHRKVLLNAEQTMEKHKNNLEKHSHMEKFNIDDRFLNHLLVHNFHCLLPVYDHIDDLRAFFPSVSDWEMVKNTVNDYFILVASHLEILHGWSNVYNTLPERLMEMDRDAKNQTNKL